MEYSKIIELTPSTVSEFVAWAAALPYERVDEIRRQIAENCDGAVVENLAATLARPEDLDSAHLEIVLAILGESRQQRAIDPLRRFVWATELFEPDLFGPIDLEEGVIDCKLWFNHGTMFRARGAEMLSFINTVAANEAILEVVRETQKARCDMPQSTRSCTTTATAAKPRMKSVGICSGMTLTG